MSESDSSSGAEDTISSVSPPEEAVELVVREWNLTLEDLFSGKDINWPSEMQSICSRCGGKGKILQPFSYRRDSDCYACQGVGNRIVVRNIKVHIPPGTEDGFEKLIKNVGWPPKDILLRVRQMNHEFFRRDGADLYMCLQLTFAEAICGFHKTIKTLDGRELVISPCQGSVTSPNVVKCIDNEGFPVIDNSRFTRGKLFIKFLVDLPPMTPDIAKELAVILQGDKIFNGEDCEPEADEILFENS